MKKLLYFVPVLLVLVFTLIGNRLFASGNINPMFMIAIPVVLVGIATMSRPKNSAPKSSSDIDAQIRGDFARDAFTDDAQVSVKFRSIVKDYCGNMPKAALSKALKLAPQCRNDQEVYALAMLTGMCCISVQNYKEAIKQYNKAVVLNPTAELACTIGSCQQRLGQLDKAKDSYEFALDLEPENEEVRSKLATAHVADGEYETALEQALLILEKNETHASALATAAICYGLTGESLMYKHYTNLAAENGYKREKITQTVDALKKRK